GLRPGESLSEELLATDETACPTDNPSIFEVLSPHSLSRANLNEILRRIRILLEDDRSEELVALLKRAVVADEFSRQVPGGKKTESASPLVVPAAGLTARAADASQATSQ